MKKNLILVISIMLMTFFLPALVIAGGSYSGEGKVNKVIKSKEMLNISHGPIKGLMKSMTMNFKVSDPAMLEDVKPGETISFSVEKGAKNSFVITDLEVTSN